RSVADKVDFAVGGSRPDGRRASFNGDRPVVVFAGRADAVRGIDVLVDAIALVRRDVPDVRLRLLLLARPDVPKLLRRIRKAGIRDIVDLRLDPVDDIRAEFAAATVSVFPFLFEHVTFAPALTAAEAMSVGLPVVATPVGCL